ncbi:uncharacterized protein LOC117610562 [Osmia lignaria lignaria]|uniref:uncharacterized protein LOC117610562 n=1 Tax=Osmia lignaria TaxID=473952 RepID=UPI0014796C53|nr:uncharacterized protein LOC117610562 [Osmia lignaria]
MTKHVRKQFRFEKDSNYGPNAEKPDMANNIYELEQKKHMEMLQNWQNRRDSIEEETIGQAKNPRWLNYKSKLLTASNFGRICRRRIGTLCGNSVKSLVYPRLISASAVQYGQECEKFAREELIVSVCIDVEIMECGLFIDSAIPFFGASPDGLIDKEGIVEIKCPKTAENLLPKEAIKSVAVIRRIFVDAEGNALNRNHYYYYQVQGQLHVTGRKYCLFCIWTRKGLKYIRVDRDDNFWQNNMEPKLIQFYLLCMLPELIDSRYNRGMPIREPQFITEERASLEKRKRSLSESSTNTATVRRRTAL